MMVGSYLYILPNTTELQQILRTKLISINRLGGNILLSIKRV